MVSFPNCKINLGLNIISKREDGYHDLETVFLPVPITDVLEILPEENKNALHLQGVGHLTATGFTVNTDDNLCIKAYNLLKQDFPDLPSVKMHLHKAIPIGAGLGGGSSDAAFTLLLLNEKFKLNLKTKQLLDHALRLGSDCPFFILNEPCFATSRGEKLQPINIDLKNYKILIVNPGININTKGAFSKIIPQERKISIQQIITQPIETWKVVLQNDFEFPVLAEYPEIKKIKGDLYEDGALYASLSGSGSSVFGIFLKEKVIKYPESTKYFNKVVEFK